MVEEEKKVEGATAQKRVNRNLPGSGNFCFAFIFWEKYIKAFQGSLFKNFRRLNNMLSSKFPEGLVFVSAGNESRLVIF